MNAGRVVVWGLGAAAFVWPVAAHAASITVSNPGFESYNLSALADGAFYKFASSGLSVTPWVPDASTDDGGLLNPGATQLPGGNAPEGNVVLWLRNGTGVSQTLSSTLAGSEIYTLTVTVGARLDAAFSGYTLQLYAGSTLLTAASATTGVASGEVRDVTLTFDSTGVNPTLVGQALKIRIAASPGLSGLDKQTEFDNVRLSSAAAVPEPWSAAVLALAGGAAIFTRRR